MASSSFKNRSKMMTELYSTQEKEKEGSSNDREISPNVKNTNGLVVHTKTDHITEKQRTTDFSINNNTVKPVFPKASLLKYEIRHLTNLKQIGDAEQYLTKVKSNKLKTLNNIKNNNLNNNKNNDNNNNLKNNINNNKSNNKDEENIDSEETMTERIRTNRYSRITDDSISGRTGYRSSNRTSVLDLDDSTERKSRSRRSWENNNNDDNEIDVDSIIRTNRLNRRSATGDELTSQYERPYRRSNADDSRTTLNHRSSVRNNHNDTITTNGDMTSSFTTRRLSARRKHGDPVVDGDSSTPDRDDCGRCRVKQERIEKLESDVSKPCDECMNKDLRIEALMNEKTKCCDKCKEKQEIISEIECELSDQKESCDTLTSQIREMELQLAPQLDQLQELESQLTDTVKERDSFKKEIRKLEKEVKKITTSLDDERVQTRRLGIKLEDANYEITRLRQELITSQLESEKVIEENEDLCVDNEDLIKERDEIIQIYDELFRESERLKHEVKIWKTVFENNKDLDISNDVQGMDEGAELLDDGVGESLNESSDEEELFEIEEDPSLLVPPRDDIKIKVSDVSKAFEQSDEISRGKFGKVYKMVARATGHVYAAKYIKVTPKLREDVLKTIDVMKQIHHVCLMNIFDVYDLGSQIVMVLEYVAGGMLFERIVERNNLTEADCALYMKQVLQGVHHLHLQHIVHLELRPENIICVNRSSMDIKIIDFGLAKQLEPKKDIKTTSSGSAEFVAPEILSFDPVSLNSDMWSIGVITYVLLSGISPFVGDDDNDTLMNVSCGEYEYDEDTFRKITSDARSFIDRLLVSNPKKRGNVASCLQHPWITSNWQAKQNPIDLEKMKIYLNKHKEKVNVSAARAIRRFSSSGLGPGHLLGGGSRGASGGNLGRTPSKHLLVPSALQSCIIAEDEEDEEEYEEKAETRHNKNTVLRKGPPSPSKTLSVADNNKNEKDSRPCSGDYGEEIPAEYNTDTPDGLRNYLQQMINTGLLPGGSGSGPAPPDGSNVYSDDDR